MHTLTNSALPLHRWKVLSVGVAANAAFAAAVAGIPTTAVTLRSAFHLDNAALGLALGLMGLGIAVSEVPWGLLTDRWGDRKVLLCGQISTAVWFALMSILLVQDLAGSHTTITLCAALFVVGILGGSVNGASGRAVMLWFREGERGLAMSIRQTAVPLGGALGALVLPAVAQAHGFSAVFAILAMLGLSTAGLTWLWIYEPEQMRHSTQTHTGKQLAPLADKRIWRLCGAIGLLCAPQIAVLTFATVFLHDVLHFDVKTTGFSVACVQIGAAISRVASGRWTDRRNNRAEYMRLCSVLTASCFVLLAVLALAFQARPSGMLSACMVAVLIAGGILASAWHGVAFAQLATVAGAHQAGEALGMGNTFAFASFFWVPMVLPLLFAPLGWAFAWLLMAICAAISSQLFAVPSASR